MNMLLVNLERFFLFLFVCKRLVDAAIILNNINIFRPFELYIICLNLFRLVYGTFHRLSSKKQYKQRQMIIDNKQFKAKKLE